MQNMMNPNKQFASVLLDNKGQAEEKEPETVDPDQGLIDASQELIKAIEKKDPKRIARCFKAMLSMCDDDEGSDPEQE